MDIRLGLKVDALIPHIVEPHDTPPSHRETVATARLRQEKQTKTAASSRKTFKVGVLITCELRNRNSNL